MSSLDNERSRLTAILNDSGYYRFNKNFIQFDADSVRGSRDVDVTLHLLKYRRSSDEPETVHPRYTIGTILFLPATPRGSTSAAPSSRTAPT